MFLNVSAVSQSYLTIDELLTLDGRTSTTFKLHLITAQNPPVIINLAV